MTFYAERVLPHLLNLAMQHKDLARYRRRVVPAAQGRVLEVGIGSGLNLPFYGPDASEVVGLDPSAPLLRMAEHRTGRSGRVVKMSKGPPKQFHWRMPALTRS